MVTAGREASMTSMMQQFGILSRTPGRILAAQTEEELRDLLANVLRGLFRGLLRFELFVTDEAGNVVPVVKLGEGQFGSGLKLLSSLTSRLRMKNNGAGLTEAHLFPALHGVKRGSLMSAPLVDVAQLIGLIVVEAAPAAADFSSFDLDVLEGIAALFSLALQRLRAKETEYVQARIELDLKTARRVQRRFMSESLPPSIGVTAPAEYLP